MSQPDSARYHNFDRFSKKTKHELIKDTMEIEGKATDRIIAILSTVWAASKLPSTESLAIVMGG